MSLLTYDQAARELAVSKRTVRRLVADQALPVVEVRGARRIREDDLAAFVEGLAVVDLCADVVSRPALRARPQSSFRSELRAVS